MPASFARRLGSLAVIAGVTLAGQAAAQSDTWISTASGNWSNAANWNNGVPISGTTTALAFNDGNYTATNDIGAVGTPFQLNSMTFNNASANTITISDNGQGLDFVGANPTITKSAGNVVINPNIILGASLTTAGGAGTLTLNGTVNDNGGGFNVNKTGTGPLVFASTGSSSFNQLSVQNGAANITAGTLALTQPSLSTTVGGVVITNNTAGLDLGTASGQTTSFTASGGATVNVTENIFVGDAAGSTGTLTVTGAGTTLNNTIGGASGRFAVGNFGNGSLSILAGASVTTRFLLTNRESGNSASILVNGTGSTLTVETVGSNVGTLQVASNNSYTGAGGGGTSTATMTVSGGATTNVIGSFVLASAPGNTGTTTVTGTGSSFAVSNAVTVAAAAGATGTVTVSSGASMSIGGQLAVSESTGVGTFNVQSGATVTLSGSAFFGVQSGGLGTLNVDGAGTTFTQNGPASTTALVIGGGSTPGGTGVFNLTNGAVASATGQVQIGSQAGSNGTVNVLSGSAFTASNTTFLGSNGASGGNPTAVGTLNVSGAGSTWTQSGGNLIDAGGATPAGTSTINVSNGGLFTFNSGTSHYVAVGQNVGSNGFLNVAGGGTFDATGYSVIVGGVGTSTPVAIGTVNVAGGQLIANAVLLGGGFTGTAGGSGVMNVTASGLVNTNFMIVGGSSSTITGTGTLNVNGGSVLVGTELDLADGGAGSLNISNGGFVSVGTSGFAGGTASFVGTVTLNGYLSTLQVNGATILGGSGGTPGGTGSVTANAGSQVFLGSTVLYAGGSLNVNTGSTGSFIVTALIDGVSGTTPSVGTVAIGTGSTLTINNSVNNVFDGVISGAGAITKTGPGTLVLTATNSYSGGTNINGGILNFSTLGNLGTGPFSFNGGTLQYATGNTADISAVAVTINNGGATIDTGSNNVTFANAIGNNLSGTGLVGGLTKQGTGTLTLNPAPPSGGTVGYNTYLGVTNVQNGTLSVPSDLALGMLNTGTAGSPVFVEGGNVTGAPAGTLAFTGTTTTPRSFAMGGGTITVASGKTVTFSGSQVSGAVLDGAGTFATSASTGASFIGVSSTASVAISSASASDQFRNFSNGGPLTVAAGVAALGNGIANFNNFTNQGSGSVTIAAGSSTNASNFQSYGMFNLTPNNTATPTVFTNTGTTPLNFNGGSQTFIGTPATADPTGQNVVDYMDLHGNNAIVAGGLFVNNGGVYDTGTAGTAVIIAEYGALVKGAGFYQNTPKTQNGGKFQTGNSPGITTFGTLIYSGPAGNTGTSSYVWQINDGGPSSTFPAAPGQAGGTSAQTGSLDFGWSLNKAVHSGPSLGNFTWNATPTDKFTIELQTLTPATTVGSDIQGPMGDFDPTLTYVWPLVTYVGTYTGPTTDAALNASTTFDTSSGPFANPTLGGTFGWHLDQVDQALDLVYTPAGVPEPGTLALTALAGLGLARSIRRRYCGAKVRGS